MIWTLAKWARQVLTSACCRTGFPLRSKPAANAGVRHNMQIVKIGSNSEFLKLEIPSEFSSEGWAQISAEINTNNFHGNISPWIEEADVYNFFNSLEELYKSLKGTASFEPREEQFTFKLEAKSGGHIEVVGAAWSEACYGSKLEFCFLLDQTFLSEPLKRLELLVSQLKANA